jgi:hypothetical protein
MSVAVSCPSCSAKLQAPDAAAGRRVKCPKCQTPIPVPGGAAPAPKASGRAAADKPSAVKAASTAAVKTAPAITSKAASTGTGKSSRAAAETASAKASAASGDGAAWEESDLLQHNEWTFREQGWMRLAIKNRHFHICKSGTKDIIGYADEKASGWVLALRGMSNVAKWLPTTVEIREEREGPLLLAIRKINIPLLPWTDVEIYDGEQQKLGHFRTKIFSLLGGFWLYDAEGKEVAEVKAKLGMPPRYLFLSKDGRELGSVATEALAKAAETNKMQVQVTLTTAPLRLKVAREMADEPRVKVLMLATALAFEFTGAGRLLQ